MYTKHTFVSFRLRKYLPILYFIHHIRIKYKYLIARELVSQYIGTFLSQTLVECQFNFLMPIPINFN